MVVPVSSLSIAIQGIADFLDTQLGPEVSVSVDSPQVAAETAKSSNNAHILNLFVYRIAPSGFHPDLSPEDPLFLRLYALLTPFKGAQGDQADDPEHRILGNAIRVLSSNPVLPTILPGPGVAGAGADDFRNDPAALAYRIQAVMQAPSMEELNHIWTTQGGELAYRLSAAYEFAVAPVEPMNRKPAPPETRAALLDVIPGPPVKAADGFIEFSDETIAIPLGDSPPGVSWLPVVLAVEGDALTTRATVTAGDTDIDIAIAGLVGEQVAIDVNWARAAPGATVSQPTQIFPVNAPLVTNPASIAPLTLVAPAVGDVATLRVRPASGGVPVPGAPDANSLTLTVTA